MADDTLRSRLEALNRGPLPAVAAVQRPGKSQSHTVQRVNAAPATEPRIASASRPIGGLIHSGEVVETPHGPHLQIDLPLERYWQGGAKLIASRQEFLRTQLATANQAIEPSIVLEPQFAAFAAAIPDRAVALDLETCGLAGAALFLVGLLRQVAGVPTIQLLLARNYAEEVAVLASFWKILAEQDVLLTFNGKTFDWPMVVERSIRHRLERPTSRDRWVHIDILHHARRRWKKQLPNCRLQTLERHVCRRHREADIPGHAIPGVYADFVRTGFQRDMDSVLHHNSLDLVTLFDLAHRLAA